MEFCENPKQQIFFEGQGQQQWGVIRRSEIQFEKVALNQCNRRKIVYGDMVTGSVRPIKSDSEPRQSSDLRLMDKENVINTTLDQKHPQRVITTILPSWPPQAAQTPPTAHLSETSPTGHQHFIVGGFQAMKSKNYS